MNSDARTVVRHRGLLWVLTRSELRSAAEESRLGWLWWLLDPLLMMAVYWIFVVILLGRDAYAPYPIFIGCALLPWRHVSQSMARGARILRQRIGLIRSTPFPTMILPLSLVLSQLAYCVLGFVVLLAVVALLGRPLSATLLQLPLLLLLQALLVAGLCLAVASLAAVFIDLQNLLEHFLRVLWYLSPGLYGTDLVFQRFGEQSLAARLFMANPFAILFEGYRAALFEPAWVSAGAWGLLALETAAVLGVGYLVYQHNDRRVVKFL